MQADAAEMAMRRRVRLRWRHSRRARGRSWLKPKRPHACCGAVRNVCCDVSTPAPAALRLSPEPLPPPKPAIVVRAEKFEASELPMDALGGLAANLPVWQPKPTAHPWVARTLHSS